MPALAERTTSQVDMSGYVPVDKLSAAPAQGIPSSNLEPGYNVYIRCPLPPVWTSSPDSLRQYYRNNLVPQTRLFNPPNPSLSVTGGSTGNVTNITGSSGSGGGGSSSTVVIAQTSLKTTSIGPNANFTGSFALSKAFQLLTIGASSPCRVRLYGTFAAQSADAYRGLDIPPPAGTVQNIICDIVLDTSPFVWTFQDRVGANGDSPITSYVYITVTNLDTISDVITLSFSYVSLVG